MKKIALIIVLLSSVSVFSQENSQWRGPDRDGKYIEQGLLKEWPAEGPKLLWHFDELGDGHASAVVTDSKVFTSGTLEDKGFVIAFDHNGTKLWKTEYGAEWVKNWDGVRSTPCFNDGKLYILSGHALISCLNAEDGKILWQVDAIEKYKGRNIQWGITENLVINENKLYCTLGGEEYNVIALDKNSGELIWKSAGKGEKSAYCSPTIFKHGGKKILVTVSEKSIMGIDAADGKLLWSYDQPNKYSVQSNTPLYHDGYLIHSSGYGKGCVKLKLSDDGTSVTKEWFNETFDAKMGGFILLNDIVYGAGDSNRKWYGIDWKTGKVLFLSDEIKKGNVIFSDDLLYCYGQDGKIALVEPKKDAYNFISTFEVPYGSKQHWAHLVIKNKRLYVRHGKSIMVYDIEKK